MITRRAIFEGRVREGMEQRFFDQVENRLAPLWQAFPHALAVRLYRIEESDDAERPVLMIQEVDWMPRKCARRSPRPSAMPRALSTWN